MIGLCTGSGLSCCVCVCVWERGFSQHSFLLLCCCQVLQSVARQRPRLSHCTKLQLEALPHNVCPPPAPVARTT